MSKDEKPKKGGAPSLVEPRPHDSTLEAVPKYGCLEITLNYPRTSAFVAKPSLKQKELYIRIWNIIKCACGIPLYSNITFEYCKSGHIHLHGYIIPSISTYYIIGYISDIVKAYLSLLPKKYQRYVDTHMYSEFNRYRGPSICVQYNNDVERFKTWEAYMRKTVLIDGQQK